jgi:hypothetical protein
MTLKKMTHKKLDGLKERQYNKGQVNKALQENLGSKIFAS